MIVEHLLTRPYSRRLDAWSEAELAPCGEPNQLRWHYWTAHGIREGCERMSDAPDISQCLTLAIGRNRLVVWQPLPTKAPGPHLTSPLCCYLQTVIFYVRPYVVNRFKRWWYHDAKKQWCESYTGNFFEWDSIETPLGWNDRVEYQGEIFEVGGGRVIWTHLAGQPRRWWMRSHFRRVQLS
jgi:hypothetical protein